MKVMAIDLGDARTGIAVSDAMGWLTGDQLTGALGGHNAGHPGDPFVE